eukprot:gb/GECH01013099.1/.p1 GENE.gb/GECH01013099.1/~~gb/GECH01013099.1/.p1  ORF type:complete len:377 (+),score=80.94 gb/GECH01013099.1/:1-1131(+)
MEPLEQDNDMNDENNNTLQRQEPEQASHLHSQPDDLILDEVIPFDVDVHPTRDLFCIALVTGEIKAYSFTRDGKPPSLLYTVGMHQEPCRALAFSEDGSQLYTASADGSFRCVDCETGRMVWNVKSAHDDGLSALLVDQLGLQGAPVVVTGDDEGGVKVWDARSNNNRPVAAFQEHADYVSDLVINETGQLSTAGGDGCVGSYDVRAGQVVGVSEPIHEGLLCLTDQDRGRRLVAGSDSGALILYNGYDLAEKPPAGRAAGVHTGSTDCLLYVDDQLVLSGGADGAVKVTEVTNNTGRPQGIIGEHPGSSVDRMVFTPDAQLVLTLSFDGMLRFFPVASVFLGDDEGMPETRRERKQRNQRMPQNTNMQEFFSGID